MNIQYYLILLFIFNLSLAQDQNILGVLNAGKNIFKIPIYNNLFRLINSKEEYYLPIKNQCHNIGLFPGIEEIQVQAEEFSSISDHLISSCKPWEKKEGCSCEMTCPRDTRILKTPFSSNNEVTVKNTLPFRNDDESFADSQHKIQAGYCWGMAEITQKFNQLAFFKKDPKNEGFWIEQPNTLEIKKNIDRILKNEVAEFNNFSSLEELARTPPFDVYIKDKIAKHWAKKAMSFEGLKLSLQKNKASTDKLEDEILGLVNQLEQNIQTELIFTTDKLRWDAHTVLVSSYKVKDGEIRFCLRDSSESIESNLNCQNYIRAFYENSELKLKYVKPNGLSDQGTSVGGFRYSRAQEIDIIKQIKNLSKYCKDNHCQ